MLTSSMIPWIVLALGVVVGLVFTARSDRRSAAQQAAYTQGRASHRLPAASPRLRQREGDPAGTVRCTGSYCYGECNAPGA